MIIAGEILVGALLLFGLLLASASIAEHRAAKRRKSWSLSQAMVVDRKIEPQLSHSDSLTPLQYSSKITYRYSVEGMVYEGEVSGGLLRTTGTAKAASRLDGRVSKGSRIPILVDPRDPRNSHYASEARLSPAITAMMAGAFFLGAAAMVFFAWKLSHH